MTTENPLKNIIIKGARMHNLKNVEIQIPRNKLVVITGLSGSGKSSLAFDTLYAEGQRRYVESLSSYARQFLGKIEKPLVDSIKGISPAIAIEQKVTSRNPRSTVGTTTEIYDYLKLLYARIGETFSPISNQIVKKQTVTDVVNYIQVLHENAKIVLLTKIHNSKDTSTTFKNLQSQGYSRISVDGEIIKIEDAVKKVKFKSENWLLLIDRFINRKEDEDNNSRIADSVQTAFNEGNGTCVIEYYSEKEKLIQVSFSNRFELDGIQFEEPSAHFFSFNNPQGACKKCEGIGTTIGIDEQLVISNKNLSIYEKCVVCWKGEKMKEWNKELILNSSKFDFPIHRPFKDLTEEQQQLIWTGNKYFKGLNTFFKYLEENSYKIQYRVMLARYRGKTICPDCKGSRLKKETQNVKINSTSLSSLILKSVDEVQVFFKNLKLNKHQKQVASRLLIEINNRLEFLINVGLGYLSLSRLSSSLSGGESQRINLATSLGSSLVGSLYILDEPSIGLHSKDTERLISVLKNLQNLGNTVIVVEHDEDIMKAADQIIDLGPEAGTNGGNLVFQGTQKELINEGKSLTAQYLTEKLQIEVPEKRRKAIDFININGASVNNLKNITTKIPLGVLTAVTGISGSGKSTLVGKVLFPALKLKKGGINPTLINADVISGAIDKIALVEFIDQNPIGKSSRSNPATYTKSFDYIRALLASQPLAKLKGFKPSHFSFNVPGGRCEMCEGEGEITVEMQFMADIRLTCESCSGKKFKEEVLSIKYQNKNIYDILTLTIDDAIDFFKKGTKMSSAKTIVNKLIPLQQVGLGYVALGQSSNTLSGGEAQRIKLASFIEKGNRQEKTLFIFDEPTTGLHFHDVKKLIKSFNLLLELKHSIIVIEHNLDVIKCADWVIDLGPKAGNEGGKIIFCGTPENLVKCKNSYTGQYLKEKF